MQIKPVSFADIFAAPTFESLIAEYADECSIKQIGPINPQPAIYDALEQRGAMQCFGAFYEGVLVGFATVLVTVLPHYGRKVATLESLFVERQSRSYGAGEELMQTIEAYAKVMGCEGVLYSAPAHGRLEEILNYKKSYTHTNTVFYRSL